MKNELKTIKSNVYTEKELNEKKPKLLTKEKLVKLSNAISNYDAKDFLRHYELKEIADQYYLIYSIDLITGNPIIYQCKNKKEYSRITKEIKEILAIQNKKELLARYKEVLKDIYKLKTQ